jgi:hypothetical protein
MYCLAINRTWTAIAELQADIFPVVSLASLLESLESLTGRSLIEKRSSEYTQQPMIMEYVTDCLFKSDGKPHPLPAGRCANVVGQR